ncbi:MAG: hypothetical protein A4E52_00618 [Pelotomaculum sp. PtaB.Bin013]|nr:MAG: hypothetical protein A4E52_00618 [Pelotomaculum sp. PtaB.Bin013]
MLQPQPPQRVFHHVPDNPLRRKKLGGGWDGLLVDFDVFFQSGKNLVLFLGDVILIQPADDLHLIAEILPGDAADKVMDDTALCVEGVGQQKLGIIVDLLKHPRQDGGKSVALRNKNVFVQFLGRQVTIFGDFALIHIVQPVRLADNVRLGAAFIHAGKDADAGGQIVVDLHEAQGDEAVEPGVGNLLHDGVIALFIAELIHAAADFAYQTLAGLILLACQKNAVVHQGAFRFFRRQRHLLADIQLISLLSYGVDQLPAGRHGVVFNCSLIHLYQPLVRFIEPLYNLNRCILLKLCLKLLAQHV